MLPYSDPFMASGTIERFDLQRRCLDLTREAIITWLLKNIPELKKED